MHNVLILDDRLKNLYQEAKIDKALARGISNTSLAISSRNDILVKVKIPGSLSRPFYPFYLKSKNVAPI